MILLWFKAGKRWLPVFSFCLIFQAASLVNIGDSIGLSPAIVALLLLLAEAVLKRNSSVSRGGSAKPVTLALLALATAYALGTAFLNPKIFEGAPVSSPRYGGRVALGWEMGHLNQVVYLLLAVALFYIVSCRTPWREVQTAVNWFVAACAVASLMALYQLTGLPFPREIFATNPSYAIFKVYEIGAFTRANSTFTEASAASSTFAVALAILIWRTLSGVISPRNLLCCLVLLGGIISTLSTTGYLCLAFLFLVASYRYLSYWRTNRGARVVKPLLAVPCLLLGLGVALSDAQQAYLSELLNSVLFQKKESQSYRERSLANEYAWETAAATSWFGAGFGVCRGSSLVPTTIGNIGVPGVTLFGLLLLTVVSPQPRNSSLVSPLDRQIVVIGLSTYLLSLVISGPEMTSPLLWFFIGACANRTALPSLTSHRLTWTAPHPSTRSL